MGIFSFGKKDDADAPRRRGAEAASSRRSNQGARVERRSRRPDRSGDAEAMLLDPTLPEKQRARRRLVGAIALVLAAIVILPMVLDSHPKPVTDDIAIDIPSRPADKAAARRDAEDTQAGVAPDSPASAEAAPGASGLAAASGVATTQNAQTTQNTDKATATPVKKPAQATTAAAQSTQAAQTPAPAYAAKPAAQQAASAGAATASRSKSQEGAAAVADNADTSSDHGANGGDSGTPAAPPGARYAVQLGAFSNDTTARNWVAKLKAAGVPAYTEQRKEADGTTRTLLRAGPFPDRASAAAAIAKVRGAGLMAGSNGNAE
ncbi:SPOR domain-containing protein [Paraburkholderia lycopersici]|uniref:DedD protein n=1 Tax=Paraburkholderia lycopersici TaxID=416944 RepID=A0A1G6WIE7_9BURK|nr:SPOR domain-containing protein [Paraburkholderia lycopersici]SDD65564.1 DedD protein [Paraburkholderia lycopersici]